MKKNLKFCICGKKILAKGLCSPCYYKSAPVITRRLARYSADSQKINARNLAGYYANKPARSAANVERERQRKKVDPIFRLMKNLRTRVGAVIRYNFKAGSAVRDLGCTGQELMTYLESKWKPEMTWDNWGVKGWHIDHIKPLISFKLENREEFLEAVHFTNLQPLWWWENISKSNRLAA